MFVPGFLYVCVPQVSIRRIISALPTVFPAQHFQAVLEYLSGRQGSVEPTLRSMISAATSVRVLSACMREGIRVYS